MNARGFLTLSSVLLVEIFIAHGMIFALVEPEEEVAFVKSPLPLIRPVAAEPAVESTPEEEAVVAAVLKEQPAQSATRIEAGPPTCEVCGGLANPPAVIQAVYLTSWSGGTQSRIDYVIRLSQTTGLNAVVIDVKDFSGEVAYQTQVPEVKQYGAERVKIWNIEQLIERLHQEGMYVIARVTVFQDPILAKARPDLAVQSQTNGGVWTDRKGLGWIDPASKEAWNYTVAIARDAASRGFDEINFDYVRFPSDGDLKDMRFPSWDRITPRSVILRQFFAYLAEHVNDVAISADLFGLSTSSRDDLGIGQVIEDAFEHFDYVYPMVYPSHYARGYLGYAKPAEYPYEVVHFSMATAQARLEALKLAYPEKKFAKLRPWIQDFDLGAEYTPLMVQAQVQAAQDALAEHYTGFLLWAPTNWYTVEVLNPFVFSQTAYDTRPRTVPSL